MRTPQKKTRKTDWLLDLARQSRLAETSAELGFIAVNGSHNLAAYRQAALWLVDGSIQALSGVVQIEENAPYVLWLKRVCKLAGNECRPLAAEDLPTELAAEWDEWLPHHALWLPFHCKGELAGGLLLARDLVWQENEIPLLSEWVEIWGHAWESMHRVPPWELVRRQVLSWIRHEDSTLPAWRRPRYRIAVAVVVVLLLPVRLSVLSPGELVPSNPAVIRSPIDGVVGQFHVRPNETVKVGQALFSFDEANLASRTEVAAQSLATAEAEYRQAAAQAVSDNKPKAMLAPLSGKIEEKRAEAVYVREMLQRSRVSSPMEGVVLFDDPSEWVGKPVVTGERIMRIASPDDVEIEAWIPVADAIPLPPGAPVNLYLAASPLFSVEATVRYMAHDATERPDGSYAYRVRATLSGKTDHRVGLKGTARLSGSWVPLSYWMLRRPIATIRKLIGY